MRGRPAAICKSNQVKIVTCLRSLGPLPNRLDRHAVLRLFYLFTSFISCINEMGAAEAADVQSFVLRIRESDAATGRIANCFLLARRVGLLAIVIL